MFDLSVLPKKAQEELIDFYHFLVQRYSKNKKAKNEEPQSKSERIDSFFDRYNIDLEGYSFNRNDIYER